MPAYMIVIARVRDRERFMRGYAPRAAELIERFGGRYLLRLPAATVLEGSLEPGQSVVVSRWPDRAAAERFWQSAEYAEVKKLREGICDAQVLLLEDPVAPPGPAS
jgi:uncharacterized protein (DUF1330 family)